MKALLIIVLLCGAGYYAYSEYWASSQPKKSRYSLSTIESNPVPQKELFELYHRLAVDMCADPKSVPPMPAEDCRRHVNEKRAGCLRSASLNAPPVIADVSTSKALGRTYLHCVRPYPRCRGVEIKTEEEARQHCG